jgi:hypothetical protein
MLGESELRYRSEADNLLAAAALRVRVQRFAYRSKVVEDPLKENGVQR